MRKAEKALNNAYNLQNKAEQAINQNQDPQAVWDLMQTVKDAYENTLEKEVTLARVREEFHLLDAEFQRVNEKRDETFRQQLETEVNQAAGELEGLEGIFNTAKEAKETYDAELTRLQGLRSAMDTDASATDQQKSDADQAV